jgi:hypothetical protein
MDWRQTVIFNFAVVESRCHLEVNTISNLLEEGVKKLGQYNYRSRTVFIIIKISLTIHKVKIQWGLQQR